jgi:hypothetical protein
VKRVATAAKRTLIVLVFLGVLVRLLLWLLSKGSNDAGIWESHARRIHEHSLTWIYGQFRLENATNFKHPPLMGYWSEGALVVAKALGLPFAILMKLRWGTYYSLLAGLFIGLVYLSWWNGTIPAESIFRSQFPMPAPFFGVIAWAFTVGIVWRILRASWKRRRPLYQPE